MLRPYTRERNDSSYLVSFVVHEADDFSLLNSGYLAASNRLSFSGRLAGPVF